MTLSCVVRKWNSGSGVMKMRYSYPANNGRDCVKSPIFSPSTGQRPTLILIRPILREQTIIFMHG
jgi:hypothetical protein